MSNIIAIDPGKDGAFAVLIDGQPPRAWVMPTIKIGKTKVDYDLPAIRDLLRDLNPSHVYVEKLQTLPPKMGGGNANYGRGRALGILEGILTALSIPYAVVSPKRWHGAVCRDIPGTDPKGRTLIAVQRAFPGINLRKSERSKKPHDGIVDSVGLLIYAMKQNSMV